MFAGLLPRRLRQIDSSRILAERIDIVRADFADCADRQIAEHERPVACPDQPADLEPEILEYAAYFAVLALGQLELDPEIGARAPFHIGVDRSVADALYFNAVDQVLEL